MRSLSRRWFGRISISVALLAGLSAPVTGKAKGATYDIQTKSRLRVWLHESISHQDTSDRKHQSHIVELARNLQENNSETPKTEMQKSETTNYKFDEKQYRRKEQIADEEETTEKNVQDNAEIKNEKANNKDKEADKEVKEAEKANKKAAEEVAKAAQEAAKAKQEADKAAEKLAKQADKAEKQAEKAQNQGAKNKKQNEVEERQKQKTVTIAPSPASTTRAPSPKPTTAAPSPAPTTRAPSPAPTTRAPSPAPTTRAPPPQTTVPPPLPASTTSLPISSATAVPPILEPSTVDPFPESYAPSSSPTAADSATSSCGGMTFLGSTAPTSVPAFDPYFTVDISVSTLQIPRSRDQHFQASDETINAKDILEGHPEGKRLLDALVSTITDLLQGELESRFSVEPGRRLTSSFSLQYYPNHDDFGVEDVGAWILFHLPYKIIATPEIDMGDGSQEQSVAMGRTAVLSNPPIPEISTKDIASAAREILQERWKDGSLLVVLQLSDGRIQAVNTHSHPNALHGYEKPHAIHKTRIDGIVLLVVLSTFVSVMLVLANRANRIKENRERFELALSSAMDVEQLLEASKKARLTVHERKQKRPKDRSRNAKEMTEQIDIENISAVSLPSVA